MEERGNDFSRDNFIELSGMTHAGSQISRALEESEEEIIKKRKEKVSSLFKKGNLIYYLLLGVIVFFSFLIRTKNITKLKDVSTGGWTLGPDLDPFLFLRWAKEIVATGTLSAWDNLRYVPFGYNTAGEMKLLAYMIAYFHKFLAFIGISNDVTYSAILFPAVMFALTTIAFFLFARKIFYKEDLKTRNIIALISTLFFVLIPSLLPRTIAGIPEKESAAFFFMFLAFYFMISALTSDKLKKGLILGVLAGISTGLMALVWGGVIFVFLTIPAAFLLEFLLGKIKWREWYVYLAWIAVSFALMTPFSSRYALIRLLTSLSTGFAFGVLIIVALCLLLVKTPIIKRIEEKIKWPAHIICVVIAIIIFLLIAVSFFGSEFITGKIVNIKSSLIQPSASRFSFTVAENRQPYFKDEWRGNFGPVYSGIPIYFWLFFVGSIMLFSGLISGLNKKEKRLLILSYIIFLLAIIFSRYSSDSLFNGTSGMSLILYFGGVLFFLISFFYVYIKRYNRGEFLEFKNFNFAYILYFIILTLGIVGARGAIRLVMVLGAVSPVVVGFLIVKSSKKFIGLKGEGSKVFYGIAMILILLASLFTMYNYYQQEVYTAENFAPGAYQWQWQGAMSWVRENTPEDAVFGHWWDYGYWLQSIGERATVLDGGNAIVYWNHLMGRYGLTGPDEKDALEFLYAHDTTHFLIDSTDIGKYTAFSSIGADENYDRFSWISTFIMDEAQTFKQNNETAYVYTGGTTVDEDIIWEGDNGEEIILPAKASSLVGIIVHHNFEGVTSQPIGVFVYKNQQYQIPLRYAYSEVNGKNIDFNSGLEAGVFIYPRIDSIQNSQVQLNPFGAMLYLSPRTINSQLAKLYLFDKETPYFELAHTEDSLFVTDLKRGGVELNHFAHYGGLQGPIKIWEIHYPTDIQKKEEYLEREFPNSELYYAKPGEY